MSGIAQQLGEDVAMAAAARVRVLGRVAVDDEAADRALGRGQARELLALLAAHRDLPLSTAQLIDALWPSDPPATAPTIVHGLVRRLRSALGPDAVANDGTGYRLALPADAVDLWLLDDAARAGDDRRVRALWRDPLLGQYADRPWAKAALQRLEHLRGAATDAGGLRRARQAAPISRLVGRRRELRAVQEALARTRLVTIVGLGGVGKSRLALEVAAQQPHVARSHVDLGATVGPAVSRVATDLGLTATGRPRWDLRAVESLIGADEHLLVIDGCEHDRSGAAAVVEALLGSCPRLRILATSRVALGVPGERVVPLLPFADAGDPRGDAVELLLDRAQSFGLPTDGQDRDRAAAICARAGGVPLAIELAVTELVFGTSTQAENAPDGLPALPRRAPDEALREMVATALGSLTEPAMTAARRAAVLVHGFTPDLLAVLVPAGTSAPGILHELVATGLVSSQVGGTPRRLRFLDPVRSALAATADHDVLLAVARAIAGVLRTVRPHLDQPVDVSALEPAVDKLPNAEALIATLADAGCHTEALDLVLAASHAWYDDGRWVQGSVLVNDVLANVRPDPAPPGYAELPPPRVTAQPIDPRTWAWGAWAAGHVAATFEGTRREHDRMAVALRVAVDAGDDMLEGQLRYRLAIGSGYGGDLAAALEHLDQLHQLEVMEAPYPQLMVSHLEGLASMVTGDAARAAEQLRATAERCEALGAPADAARCWRVYAHALRTLGDLDGARQALETAETRALEGRSRGTLATIRTDLVDFRMRAGDVDRSLLLDALAAVVTVGNLRAAGLLRLHLGAISGDPGPIAEGALDLLESDRIWAAYAVARLVERLPRRHPLRSRAPGLVARLRAQWGSPLGVEEAALVDALADPAAAPQGEAWEDELRDALRDVVRDAATGGAASGTDPATFA